MKASAASSRAMSRLIAALSALLFGHRKPMLALFALITVGLAISATGLRVDAGFKKMIPLQHPYMKTFTAYEDTFGGANPIVVTLMRRHGDIFDAKFLSTLKAAHDEVYFIPGVDRPSVQSLFSPSVRFIEVVESGFTGGNVMPATYAGTPGDLAQVRRNVEKAGIVGRLVANDLHGALIRATLLDVDPATGQKLDYGRVADALEALRARFESDDVDVHIIGFAKAVGDISAGARGVIAFFGVAFLITAVMMFLYTRSALLSAVALGCALLPVLWLLGTLPLIGYGIDPMSILVPFLIFSIGCSHAVQMTNAWKQARVSGHDALQASEVAFAQLFVPGTLALLTNALGFLVIMMIKIDIVRELGVTATIGVTLMIVTNKMVLPILLSYLRIDAARIDVGSRLDPLWRFFARFADRRRAGVAIGVALVLAGLGAWQARHLTVGDLGEGLPELRADSRYNQDVASITRSFSIGVDVLSLIVQTHGFDGACTEHAVMDAMDAFEWRMRNVEGVRSSLSLAGLAKTVNVGWYEGNVRWATLPRNKSVLAQAVTPINTDTGLLNPDCSAMQILLFAQNHRGDTLARIVQSVKDWNAEFVDDPQFKDVAGRMAFKLASGTAGVMAATNEAVAAADKQELAAIFAALALMCLLTFRSITAVLCILLPLALVSLLNNALMATLGIGLKVSTLPVIALGVGVGVDYGIYLFDRIQAHLREGRSRVDAVHLALGERGTAAAFTAVTMSLGVGTWIFSALKFQADMGLLLSFMFLVNMLGAVSLMPALLAFGDLRHAPQQERLPDAR